MRVLISGAGIAGPTLAYWLAHYGFQPTLVESAAHLRTAGYVIDFWGAGYDIADRMGLLPEIMRKGYQVREVRVVNAAGKRIAAFSTEAVARVAQGRFTSIPRGDLAASIFSLIEGRVETLFGDSVRSLVQTENAVRVTFESGGTREFDLVIGGDGLHSRIRRLVFGEEKQFERYLGYKAVAFEIAGYPMRDELVYLLYTQVGQQTGRFTLRGDRTMFLFTFRDREYEISADREEQKALLHARFSGAGWEYPQILNALSTASDLYFDRVSQIQMNHAGESWNNGRVALVGDAASCVSLLAGQGSALAMVAAYILAGELHRARGNYAQAFERYQSLFGPFVLQKQNAARRLAGFFAPKSKLSMFLRNQVINLMAIPWITDVAIGRDLVDKIEIPEY
ncbi:MAG TPA: FAD-binding domain [Terracidiphilus sp.]|nr:FAD-binding domain [Terracidiphilus sp.]